MPAGKIPIRNIYYLFLYAWSRFPEGKQIEAGTEDSPDLPNLLARVLANGVRRLVRRGVHRDYVTFSEELRAPRGRILVTPSVTGGSLIRNRITCAFDELTPDVLPNRILKTMLRRLANHGEIDAPLAEDLRVLARQLGPVDEVRLNSRLFRSVSLPRNNGHYDLLMRICEMAFLVLQPEEGGTGSTFAALLEDEERMSAIFEQFLRNFYATHLHDYSVASENIDWDTAPLDDLHRRYLPGMRTDVLLRSDKELVVVDAKFYRETFAAYRGGHPKIRSGHLYQLLTYVESARRAELAVLPVRGLLIYPAIDGLEINLNYVLDDCPISIRTIDFARPWEEIHESLCSIQDGIHQGRTKTPPS